jgi:hypothetical protein
VKFSVRAAASNALIAASGGSRRIGSAFLLQVPSKDRFDG